MCSTEKKFLEKVKSLALRKVEAIHHEKVLFRQPDDLSFYLEKEAAWLSGQGTVPAGCRNREKYRREAVGQVILQVLRRMKEEK
jgi:hypothetical protein